MKRIIKATSDFNSELTDFETYTRNRQKFAIHQNNPADPNNWKATISEIHPYDDAEYLWARVGKRGTLSVEFIQNGKVIDTMQLHYYEPDEYEHEEEYYDEVTDAICLALLNFNKDVEPIMIHN
jgi:hypothetical protein